MSVYVDELRAYGHGPTCLQAGSCHLTADTPEELHAFAAKLGLQRWWAQEHRGVPHYDISDRRRARAVVLGAVETTAREQARTRKAC